MTRFRLLGRLLVFIALLVISLTPAITRSTLVSSVALLTMVAGRLAPGRRR
jgi:hypothetical protein